MIRETSETLAAAPTDSTLSDAALTDAARGQAPAAAKRRSAWGEKQTLTWWVSLLGIVAIHVATVIAFARGVTPKLALLAFATYLIRIFAITAVYHRYFSHRAYKTSRPFQFLLALLGLTATQKGPLWWASTHRVHHKHSDTELDVHSPLRRGFWYSHMFWWLSRDHENTDLSLIKDFAKYPELRFLDRFHLIGPALLSLVCWLIAGNDGILWGFVVSTCFLMHATFTINSLAHVFGKRRFATTDTSRNNVWLAIITLGEGWHNNHHHYMASANQGFYWYEIDVSYYVLKGLEKLRLVSDLKKVPDHVLRRDLIVDVGERCTLLIDPAKTKTSTSDSPASSPDLDQVDPIAAE